MFVTVCPSRFVFKEETERLCNVATWLAARAGPRPPVCEPIMNIFRSLPFFFIAFLLAVMLPVADAQTVPQTFDDYTGYIYLPREKWRNPVNETNYPWQITNGPNKDRPITVTSSNIRDIHPNEAVTWQWEYPLCFSSEIVFSFWGGAKTKHGQNEEWDCNDMYVGISCGNHTMHKICGRLAHERYSAFV
jgi:hypothetical protein